MKYILAVSLILIGLLISEKSVAATLYRSTVDLPMSTLQHRLVDAEFKVVPTKIERSQIPGCDPFGEISQDCSLEVVTEARPVIAVNISYQDLYSTQEGNEPQWLTLQLDPQQFSPEDVAALKAASPAWKHPFSKVGRNFAKRHLSLQVDKMKRVIRVTDPRNSRICSINESGEVYPGCEDSIAYKTSTTQVKQISVLVK